MRRRLLYSSLAAGLISILAQSLIIRELVIAFLGNELVIGVTLGAWLLGTGLGSATLGRWGERAPRPARWLHAELTWLAVLLPVSFLLVRHAPALAGLEPREVAGPVPIILVCLAVLGPLCVVNGSVFPTLCRAVSGYVKRDRAIAGVYMWEAVGSAAGGALFAAVLVRLAQPAWGVFGCSALAAVFALIAAERRTPHAAIATAVVLMVAAAVCLESADLSEHANTIYGRTTITRREKAVSVYHSGILSFTRPPRGETENLVHLALLQLERPGRVLLIGGLGGAADTVLQHPVTALDVVELDPKSVRFVLEHTPRSAAVEAAMDGRRMRLLYRDGRRHVTAYDGAPYDAVLLYLRKPVTAQINRYYTVEFFEAAERILSDGGVLAFTVESVPSLSTPEPREYIACLRRTLAGVFGDVLVTPGTDNVFLARKGDRPLLADANPLLMRLFDRGITPQQFDATVGDLLNAFNREVILEGSLAESTSSQVNTDLRPTVYSHALTFWAAKERTPRSGAWRALIDVPTGWLHRFAAWPMARRWLAGLAAAGVCAGLLALWRPRRRMAAGIAVGCSGFTEIAVEIVALIAFQVLYGYVYALLGLVLASFMVGLCVGGACAGRIIRGGRRRFAWLVGTQGGLAVYPLLLVGVIGVAAETGARGWLVAAAFLALTFVAGFTGGMQFPLAASTAGEGRGVAAAFSALDLCGAAVGALTVSAFLIPSVGFVTLGVFLSGVGAVAWVGLCVARRPRAQPAG